MVLVDTPLFFSGANSCFFLQPPRLLEEKGGKKKRRKRRCAWERKSKGRKKREIQTDTERGEGKKMVVRGSDFWHCPFWKGLGIVVVS